MTVSLTPAEAESKISQIESARDQVNATLNKILDMQKDMLSSAWQGGSATRYNSTADQQHEDFTRISTDLNTVVETGAAHMRSIASMDDDD
jgi:WXG100 family type VII secretion target